MYELGQGQMGVEEPPSQLQPALSWCKGKEAPFSVSQGCSSGPTPLVTGHRAQLLHSHPEGLCAVAAPSLPPRQWPLVTGEAAEAQQMLAPCFRNRFASWPVAPVGLHSGMAPGHALQRKAEREGISLSSEHWTSTEEAGLPMFPSEALSPCAQRGSCRTLPSSLLGAPFPAAIGLIRGRDWPHVPIGRWLGAEEEQAGKGDLRPILKLHWDCPLIWKWRNHSFIQILVPWESNSIHVQTGRSGHPLLLNSAAWGISWEGAHADIGITIRILWCKEEECVHFSH